MTREEATIYIKEWLKDEYLDSKDRAALTAIIEESEQEPKYCDRNICIRNEYNGIGCGECEVTKSGEPCTDAVSRTAITEYLQRIVAATNIDSQYNEGFVDGIEFCITNISTMPPVTPQPKTIQEKGE